MICQYYDECGEICTNADCPYCADYCPVSEAPEICRYSGLDDTETMLRSCLDNEREDFQQAVQALAEENEELKKKESKVLAALQHRICNSEEAERFLIDRKSVTAEEIFDMVARCISEMRTDGFSC